MIGRTSSIDRLFEAVMQLSSTEECYDFFEDICTVKELLDMSKRLDAAVLLSEGRSYQQIVEATGLSTATIGRVSRCLNYGQGGYVKAIARLASAEKASDGTDAPEHAGTKDAK